MNHDEPHRREVLAASEVCSVERCDCCGVVHLNVGATTVRFTPESFAVLCATVGSAFRRANAMNANRGEKSLGGGGIQLQ